MLLNVERVWNSTAAGEYQIQCFFPYSSDNGDRTGFSQKLNCQFDYSGDPKIEVSLRAGCLNNSVGKQQPGIKWSPER